MKSGMYSAVSVERLQLSERFVSLQGEGVSVGAPAAFVRLGRCNLACSWCDTPYTWDFERYSFDEEIETVELHELVDWLEQHSPGRVIWTGGEPLIQQKPLLLALRALDERRLVTGQSREIFEVETNGTVRPLPALLERVDQWNVSPKLGGAGEPRDKRIVPAVIASFARHPQAYFKFVLASEEDAVEAEELVEASALDRRRVLFMPAASTVEELRQRSGWVAARALSARVRFSGRLHLELFGGRRGT